MLQVQCICELRCFSNTSAQMMTRQRLILPYTQSRLLWRPAGASCEQTVGATVLRCRNAQQESSLPHISFEAVSSCRGEASWQTICQCPCLMPQCCVYQELKALL